MKMDILKLTLFTCALGGSLAIGWGLRFFGVIHNSMSGGLQALMIGFGLAALVTAPLATRAFARLFLLPRPPRE